jgi:hypothetical protein
MRWLNLFLACQYLNSGTYLRECEDQSWFKVQAVPYKCFLVPQVEDHWDLAYIWYIHRTDITWIDLAITLVICVQKVPGSSLGRNGWWLHIAHETWEWWNSYQALTFREVHLGICSQAAFTKKTLPLRFEWRKVQKHLLNATGVSVPAQHACSHPAQKSSRQPADQRDAAPPEALLVMINWRTMQYE